MKIVARFYLVMVALLAGGGVQASEEAQLRQEIEQLKRHLHSQEKFIARLQEHAVESEGNCGAIETALSDTKKRIAELQKTNEDLNDENLILHAEMQKLSQQSGGQGGSVAALRAQVTALEEENARLHASLGASELVGAVEDTACLDELQKQTLAVIDLQRQVTSLQAQNTEQAVIIADLTSRLATYESDLATEMEAARAVSRMSMAAGGNNEDTSPISFAQELQQVNFGLTPPNEAELEKARLLKTKLEEMRLLLLGPEAGQKVNDLSTTLARKKNELARLRLPKPVLGKSAENLMKETAGDQALLAAVAGMEFARNSAKNFFDDRARKKIEREIADLEASIGFYAKNNEVARVLQALEERLLASQ